MLTKEKSLQIKGIAILLMVFHHLFGFSDRIPYGSEILLQISILKTISSIGKMCVSFFMFLGGYALYIQFMKHNQLNIINNIKKLFFKYWKVFLIFVPIGFVFFSNQSFYTVDSNICNRFSNFNILNLLLNFFGIMSTINREWWFFQTYILSLFIGKIFITLFKNNRKPLFEILFIIVVFIFLHYFFPKLLYLIKYTEIKSQIKSLFEWYISLFLLGISYCKYNIYNYKIFNFKFFCNKNKIINFIISFSCIILCILLKKIFRNDIIELLVIPIIIYCLINMIDIFKNLSKILSLLGKHSTNIWLCHTFFCYYFYFFVKLIYFSNNPLIIFLLTMFFSLCSSYIIEFLWNFIFNIKLNKYFLKKKILLNYKIFMTNIF